MKTDLSSSRRKNLLFYFQIHQPTRLRRLRFFDIGTAGSYFDDSLNEAIIRRVSEQCYLPMNALLLNLIRKHPEIKVCFSISGVTLDQFEQYTPEVLASFRALSDTGNVEFLAETYYHSLACMNPGNDFELQVEKHQKAIMRHFGQSPRVFRNTELIYSDALGSRIHEMGFSGAMVDGVDHILAGRSPHHVFIHPKVDLKLLPRNYHLSDDIAFRYFHNGERLTPERYLSWLLAIPADENVVTIAFDYETFGEHQKKDTGIFRFMKKVLTGLAKDDGFRLLTPSEAIELTPKDEYSAPSHISWADRERNLSAWLGNDMQRDAFGTLLKLEKDVKDLHDKQLLKLWRSLETSDHFYYMSTKSGSDGEVHSYFSPYPSPYEAFINYMNVLTDFALRIKMKKDSTHTIAEQEVNEEREAILS